MDFLASDFATKRCDFVLDLLDVDLFCCSAFARRRRSCLASSRLVSTSVRSELSFVLSLRDLRPSFRQSMAGRSIGPLGSSASSQLRLQSVLPAVTDSSERSIRRRRG